MKLSDAMEEGSKLIPQIKGHYHLHCEIGYISCGCALGQAYVGLTGEMYCKKPTSVEDRLITAFPLTDIIKHPYLGQVNPKYPDECVNNCRVLDTIVSLNDYHNWTTAQIVEWLRSEGL